MCVFFSSLQRKAFQLQMMNHDRTLPNRPHWIDCVIYYYTITFSAKKKNANYIAQQTQKGKKTFAKKKKIKRRRPVNLPKVTMEQKKKHKLKNSIRLKSGSAIAMKLLVVVENSKINQNSINDRNCMWNCWLFSTFFWLLLFWSAVPFNVSCFQQNEKAWLKWEKKIELNCDETRLKWNAMKAKCWTESIENRRATKNDRTNEISKKEKKNRFLSICICIWVSACELCTLFSIHPWKCITEKRTHEKNELQTSESTEWKMIRNCDSSHNVPVSHIEHSLLRVCLIFAERSL